MLLLRQQPTDVHHQQENLLGALFLLDFENTEQYHFINRAYSVVWMDRAEELLTNRPVACWINVRAYAPQPLH